jgi:hypothetical protein
VAGPDGNGVNDRLQVPPAQGAGDQDPLATAPGLLQASVAVEGSSGQVDVPPLAVVQRL